jgi:DNA-binding NtrC family response regulator
MTNKARILVVDDEEVVRLSHLRTLASEHCKVEAVWNGTDALQAMGRQTYDLVLLDLRMPGMDGLSVLKAIKQNWPEIEVIVITGYPEIESAKQATRLGAYDYLAKPVGPDEVISAANSAMLHKRWALHRDPSPASNESMTSSFGCQSAGLPTQPAI